MQYGIRAGLIIRPERYRGGLNPEPGLSDSDRARERLFYPEMDQEYDELKRFKADKL